MAGCAQGERWWGDGYQLPLRHQQASSSGATGAVVRIKFADVGMATQALTAGATLQPMDLAGIVARR
jgi:hypothetical protein